MKVNTNNSSRVFHVFPHVSPQKLLSFFLCFFVAVLPVFVVPVFYESSEFSRQLLLWGVGSVVVLLWFWDVMAQKTVVIRGGWWNMFFLVFSVLLGISTLLSVDRAASFFGGGVLNNAFLTLMPLSLLLFVLMQWLDDRNRVLTLISWMAVGNALAVIVAVLGSDPVHLNEVSFFGRYIVTQTPGDLSAMFFTLMLPLALMVFVQRSGGWKMFAGVLMLLDLIGIVWWGNDVTWFVLSIGLFGLLVIFWIHANEVSRRWNTVVSVIFIISVLLWATPLGNVFYDNAGARLHQEDSWSIAKDALAKHVLFGEGPGTWPHIYTENYPVKMNATALSDVLFSKAGNEAATIVATWGVIPSGALFLSVMFLFIAAFRALARKKTPTKLRVFELLLLPAIMAAAAAFLVPFTMTLTVISAVILLLFAWWILNISGPQKRVYGLDKLPSLSFGLSFLLGWIGVGIVSLIYLAVRIGGASVYAYNALAYDDIDKAVYATDKARQSAPWDIRYQSLYLDVYSQSALAQENPEDSIGALLENVAAVDRSFGDHVLMQERIASIYASLYIYVGPSLNGVIDASYARLLETQPNNARLRTEYAESLLARSVTLNADNEQSVDETFVRRAHDQLDKAEDLRPGDMRVAVARAHAYEILHNIDDAISTLENAMRNAPLSVDAGFQLASLYAENGQTDDALDIYTAFANVPDTEIAARTLRSSLYETLGKRDEALEDLRALQELLPDEAFIQDRIDALTRVEESAE